MPRGIRGLTGQDSRLPRIRKLHIGLPKPSRGPGRPIDWFRLAPGDPAIPDEAILKEKPRVGDGPRRPTVLACTLAPMLPEQISDAAMRNYRAGGLWCQGDGGDVARRRGSDRRFHELRGGCVASGPNGSPCPFIDKECKANTRLYVVLKGDGMTKVTEIETNSKWSISNFDALIVRASGLGRQLWEVPMELHVQMQKMATPRGSRSMLPIMSLQMSETMQQVRSRLDHAARGLLPSPEPPVALLPGDGVSRESRDEEPSNLLLYGKQSEPDTPRVVANERLMALEAAAVAARAEVRGHPVKPGTVERWFDMRERGVIDADDETIAKRLETAIRGAGGIVPGEEPASFDAEFVDAD